MCARSRHLVAGMVGVSLDLMDLVKDQHVCCKLPYVYLLRFCSGYLLKDMR